MEQKLVSIALATYNGEKFLRNQLDSLLAQTYKNIEIIVCDDCSKDGTVKILEEYKTKHKITYYVNEKNLGYIKNFEKVIGLCSGEYIALSDQDDVWLDNKIELLVNNIGDCSLIFSDASLIDENGDIFEESFHDYQNIYMPENYDQYRFLLFRNFVTGCTSLFKKEILSKAIPFIDSIPHDWWIALNASMIGEIKKNQSPLVQYRQHSNNAIGAKKITGFKFTDLYGKFKSRRLKILKEIDNTTKMINALKSRYSGFDKLSDILKVENDCEIYRKSISRKFPLHISAFLIAWKYRKLWYIENQTIYAMSKLIV